MAIKIYTSTTAVTRQSVRTSSGIVTVLTIPVTVITSKTKGI